MNTFWVETVYLDCSNVEEDDVVKVLEHLKEKKPDYLKLYFECPMISDSLWQLMLNCEADVLIISVDREVKVSLDNVPLLFNCECIILHGVKFSEKGMNLLFKHWQSSKERILQCVSLTRKVGPFRKKQANEKNVLKGIDVESVEKKRIFKVKKDGVKKSTTYNLVKNDGELATLKLDKREICFHTGNDH